MKWATVNSSKYKSLTLTLCSCFLLLTSHVACQDNTREQNTLVEQILYIQVSSDSEICENGQSVLFPFEEGGATQYFNYKFRNLMAVIQEQSRTLKQETISNRSPAPNSAVADATLAINNADSEQVIVETVFLLGESSSLIHCYKNGAYSSCIDEYSQIYDNTKNAMWIYQRDCEGWRATFRNSDVQIQDDQLVKVVPSVKISLKKSDINQCPASPDGEFSGTAFCPSDSTECKHLNGSGFKVGSYQCICTQCPDCDPIDGVDLSLYAFEENSNVTTYINKHCAGLNVAGNQDSLGQGDITYLDNLEIYVMLGIQALCIIVCLIFAVIVVIKKSSKVIQSSKPLVLGLILFGAILKYVTILCVFLSPTRLSITCVIQPWLAEVGFICMFGAVVLKTYKSLAEFQTRKARRVHIRDKDLLKYWSVCLLLVVIYLASYTAVTLNLVTTQNASLVELLTDPAASIQNDAKCRIFWSNYVTQITEILFVAFGFYMATRLRSAPSLYWENRWYAAALLTELITSIVYYIISDVLVSDSYYTFIVYFVYLQLSVTVSLLLVFCPKFYYLKKAPATDGVFLSGTGAGNRTDLVDFRTHGPAANGEIDIDEINIAEMSPEEIKKELRRVYEQLQTLKVKVMRYENPHLQGKRGHSKSKLPFYKQISKHGAKKSGRGSAADVSEEAELEPLNTPQISSAANDKNSSSHAKETNQLSF